MASVFPIAKQCFYILSDIKFSKVEELAVFKMQVWNKEKMQVGGAVE